MTPWTLGAALEVNSSAKTERKQNGVDVGTVAGMTTMGLKLYTPYVITETITLLPSFTYTKATAYDDAPAATGGSGIDSVTGWTLAVGGRFQF